MSEHLPVFVGEAVDRCVGFGVGLIVTHQGASTHRPGALLPDKLRRSVGAACRGGWIWHPMAKQLVPADPAHA